LASGHLGHSKIGITLDLGSDVLPKEQADAAAIVDDALPAALKKTEPKGQHFGSSHWLRWPWRCQKCPLYRH